MKSAIDEKISHLSIKLITKKKMIKTHWTKVTIEQLKMLHYKFNVGTMDTAFVCQKHYAHVLINKLGLNNANNKASIYMRGNQTS